PGVVNDGVITAHMGKVQLTSGQTFTAVDTYGDGLYAFSVGQNTVGKAVDQNGKALAAAVSNTGAINAQGGTVYMTASAAKAVVDSAINATGIVDATAIHNVGGTIVLDGGENNVTVAGRLDASGKGAGQSGGTVKIAGSQIDVAPA